MNELKLGGLEHEAGSTFEKARPWFGVSVQGISDQGVSDRIKMASDLVKASRVRMNFHQAEPSSGFQAGVVGSGGFGLIGFVLFQGGLDAALGGRLAHAPCMVGLLHFVFLEKAGEGCGTFWIEGKQDEARRIRIDPVNRKQSLIQLILEQLLQSWSISAARFAVGGDSVGLMSTEAEGVAMDHLELEWRFGGARVHFIALYMKRAFLLKEVHAFERKSKTSD